MLQIGPLNSENKWQWLKFYGLSLRSWEMFHIVRQVTLSPQHETMYNMMYCIWALPAKPPGPARSLWLTSILLLIGLTVWQTQRGSCSQCTRCGSATVHELAFIRPNARVRLPSARRSEWLVVTAGVFRWHSSELISLAQYAVSFCNCFTPYTKGVRTVTDCSQ